MSGINGRSIFFSSICTSLWITYDRVHICNNGSLPRTCRRRKERTPDNIFLEETTASPEVHARSSTRCKWICLFGGITMFDSFISILILPSIQSVLNFREDWIIHSNAYYITYSINF